MKITFQIKETRQNVISDLRASDDYTEYEKNQLFVFEYEDKEDESFIFGRIEDKYFDCACDVKISFNKIIFKTAWSGFKYTVFEQQGKTFITYEGAWLGLLAQNLLPVFTPVWSGKELVESTLGNMPLANYISKQDEHQQKKYDSGIMTNFPPYCFKSPYCFKNVKIRNTLTDKEREDLKKWAAKNPLFCEILEQREKEYYLEF